ncbi:MAG TPA: hypothetical protein VE984_04035 [Gaiellaceae bacterium]|nr:hypothetical protein [Gaiellaceae bacterium]
MLRLLSPRLAAAALAGLAVGAGGGFALAAAVGHSPAPAKKAAALARLATVATTDSNTEPAPPPDFAQQPIPARMLGSGTPVPVGSSVLRARNGWLVSNGRTLVAVYAGAAGDDPAIGRLVIVRQNLRAGKQTVRIVDAGPTGALTIAGAPLGGRVETSAQTVSLRLRTAGGRLLRLDLARDAVGGP